MCVYIYIFDTYDCSYRRGFGSESPPFRGAACSSLRRPLGRH